MSVILADLGGTHLRLASPDNPSKVHRVRLDEIETLEKTLAAFSADAQILYLATAVKPVDGIIEDTRFGGQARIRVDLDALQKTCGYKRIIILNDLEAATHALSALAGPDLHTLLPGTREQIHFTHPPKLLIGVGTGIGHAFLHEQPGTAPFVQATHGGHVPAFALSPDQRKAVEALSKDNQTGRDVIAEHLVSGTGLAALKEKYGEAEALRLFFEMLGLYAHMVVGLSGAYGGVYLTGGVMDELFARNAFAAKSFGEYFHRPMVPVVVDSLLSTPVYYCKEQYMAIRGLAAIARQAS